MEIDSQRDSSNRWVPYLRRKQTVRKVLLTPIPWEEEPLNHRPRCSGNLSLWDGPGHGAVSKTSKYSSGWVIMTDAELAPLWGLKWELWQCLNAAAPGLELFMGSDWERQCRASWGAGWEPLWQGNPAASATPLLLQKATNTQQHTSYFRSCPFLNCWHTWRTLFLQRSLGPFKVGRPGEKQRHAMAKVLAEEWMELSDLVKMVRGVRNGGRNIDSEIPKLAFT